jgi:hypothetical protein
VESDKKVALGVGVLRRQGRLRWFLKGSKLNVVMTGLMRAKLASAKGALRVLAFTLIIPFGEGAVHSMPKPVPATYPTSLPTSMKAKEEPKQQDPTPMVASMRAASGSMVKGMLRARDYRRLVRLHRKLNEDAPASQLVKAASRQLAKELKILQEAESFDHEDKLHVAIVSVFLSSGNLMIARLSEAKLVDDYAKRIDSLGFPKLAKAVRQWLKNGKGDKIALYKTMRVCCVIDGGR